MDYPMFVLLDKGHKEIGHSHSSAIGTKGYA